MSTEISEGREKGREAIPGQTGKNHVAINMSRVIGGFRQNFGVASSVTLCAEVSSHDEAEKFGAWEIWAHVTGDSSPERSRKWPKVLKMARKVENLVKMA